ncbi:hypothetical protein LDG_5848 [Legionella drancourtii LLAP12]|uniref:Carrier domain-containing protein n=2 Tax=Legionella drancourtii TaxID=168933 RepID=G9EKV4_9GAMM|nr:hypothetical protein LDG_5848 [Legionella drancourtii LLAP12]
MPIQDISIHHSLHELGMDSLMALAVIRIIEANLGITYSLPLMMQGPSILEIADHVLSQHTHDFKPNHAQTKNSADALWLANRKLKADAQVRLFCFPYGGGGASIYREWQQEFPDFIEVCPIQLPGRENRLEEQPLADLNTLVSLLARHLRPHLIYPLLFLAIVLVR